MLAKHVLPLAATAAAFIAIGLPAQRQTSVIGGHSHLKLTIDAVAATTDARCWGAEYLNGEFFVTADGLSGASTAPHDVYVFDKSGAFVRQFTQSPHTDPSRLGWIDLATDGQSLICGSDLGIHVIDKNGNLVNTVQANNGPQPITQPITGPALGSLSAFFGVAYDPGGNGGNGSLWLGDGALDLFEVDLGGNVLQQFVNQDNWFIRGIARDHVTGKLWVNSVPHRGLMAEVDPTTGRTTGLTIAPANQQFPGGLGVIRGGAFGAELDLIGFTQTDDALRVYRVHLHPGLEGTKEPRLLTDTSPALTLPNNLDTSIKAFRPASMLGYKIDASGDPTLNGKPAALFWNFGVDAHTTAVTRLPFLPGNPVLPELAGPNPISIPASPFLVTTNETVGATSILAVPFGLPVSDGMRIRLQGLILHPSSPVFLLATNDQILEGYASNIVVECEGTDSYGGHTQYGFFRVTHTGGSPIDEVTFDFTQSTNPGHVTTEFDTDSTVVGYRFDGGNSANAECGHTFRNRCDVLCGLIYDAQNTIGACDPAAFTGWEATNPGNAGNDWRTVKFRFAPGQFDHQRFEFDCDTDSGPGINGGSHAGMVVIIKLQNGATHQGELVAHPTDPNRASIAF